MESNYYHVKFYVSNGKVRVIEDVKAYAADEAANLAIANQNDERIILEEGDLTYVIYKEHLVEIVVEKVDSPEERSKQQKRNLDAMSRIM